MEQGIQCLRELAVIEIIFSDDQAIRSPDMVKRTPVMWLKLARHTPPEYTSALAMMTWNDGDETVSSMVRRQTLCIAQHKQELQLWKRVCQRPYRRWKIGWRRLIRNSGRR